MLFAELVSHAASTFQMVLVRRARECHTQAAPEDLPRATQAASYARGLQTAHTVRIRNPSALCALTGPPPSRGTRVEQPRLISMPRSVLSFRAKAHSATDPEPRDQKLAFSPLMPTNVGIQGRPRAMCRLAAASLRAQHNRSWIPTAHSELVEGRRNQRFMLRQIGLIQHRPSAPLTPLGPQPQGTPRHICIPPLPRLTACAYP